MCLNFVKHNYEAILVEFSEADFVGDVEDR